MIYSDKKQNEMKTILILKHFTVRSRIFLLLIVTGSVCLPEALHTGLLMSRVRGVRPYDHFLNVKHSRIKPSAFCIQKVVPVVGRQAYFGVRGTAFL